ncbi:hypothetical protein BUALT_Bualt12G0123100 [Buddleja alternifolia]|uniref:Myb/SANT-like domain-containing protein n=1 Tax=Buddleja alternifolia TaxID=168488 RepID=A0AAV6WZ58_9LAMI|nr:hypothetical protein BUALT_Bualt12G0123100 [Buddleja alternifolia]
MAHASSVGTSCKGKKAVVCRRMWTRSEEDMLVQALKELLTTGWKFDNGCRVGYLNILQDKMMMAFPRTDLHSNPHISSKMHSWKKQYNTLFTIFGGIGVGWNLTTKMIETDDDEAWETAYRADGTGAEDFHDALNGILHAESQPKSPPDTHLDDNDMPYTPLVDEDAPPSVCEAGSSTTTKTSNKGKRKKKDSIIGRIMADINKFTDTTDSRLGEIVSKMGHEHDMTRKCEAVFEIVNQIDDLTLDEKIIATNLIVKNTQVLAMFFSLPDNAKVGQQYPDASQYKLRGEVNWEKLSEVFDDDLGDDCVDHPSNSSDLAVHETSEETEIVPDRDYLEYLICMEFKYDLG